MSEPTPPPALTPPTKPPFGFGDTIGEGIGLGCALLLVIVPLGVGAFIFGLANDVGLAGVLVGGLVVPVVVAAPVVLWARRRGWPHLAQGVIVAVVIGLALLDAAIGGCWSIINS